MKLPRNFTEESELVAVRLPKVLRADAKRFCKEEDMTMSQLMRRAVKRELEQPLTFKPEATR